MSRGLGNIGLGNIGSVAKPASACLGWIRYASARLFDLERGVAVAAPSPQFSANLSCSGPNPVQAQIDHLEVGIAHIEEVVARCAQ